VRPKDGAEDGRWGEVDTFLVLEVSKEAFSVLKATSEKRRAEEASNVFSFIAV